MLFREKIVVSLLVIFCLAFLTDLYTPYGNQYWETKNQAFGRYIVNQGSKIGYINARGRLVVWPRWEGGLRFFEGDIAPVKSGEKWGYIDRFGKVLVKPRFKAAEEFSQGLALVADPGIHMARFGYIDRKGQFVVRPRYIKAKSFSQGLAAVYGDDAWGYIDTEGKNVIDAQFEEARDFSEGLAAVKLGGQWGYIDKQGEFVIPPKFEDASDFQDGLAPVKVNGSWRYIDAKGQAVTTKGFETANDFSDGLAMVKEGGQFKFINAAGDTAIVTENIIEAKNFCDGFAVVCASVYSPKGFYPKCGYINERGDYLVEPKFDWAWDFQGGLARVGLDKNDTRRGYLNRQGRLIWDPANWEKTDIAQKAFYGLLAFLLTGYVPLWLRLYRQRRRHYDMLVAEQSARPNVTVRGGFFREPALFFKYGEHVLSMQFVPETGEGLHPGVRIDSSFQAEEEHRFIFYVNMTEDKIRRHCLDDKSVIKTADKLFDEKIRIPRSSEENFIRELLTPEIKAKFLECPLISRIIQFGFLKSRMVILLNLEPADKQGYDWFIDVTRLMYERANILAMLGAQAALKAVKQKQ